MLNNGKGVLVFNASNIRIANNLILGCTDANSGAIRDEGNVTGMSITGNTILFNKGAGISIVSVFPPGQSSNVNINFNNIAFNAGGGLYVQAGAYTGTLDARYNWWGGFFGFSCDSLGNGTFVTANGNTVVFSPFSRFPIFAW